MPVTYAYISDAHETKSGQTGCSNSGAAQGPGDTCYQQKLANYNAGVRDVLPALADDGINASNTEFVFAADEGDHFAGANVGRSVDPTPRAPVRRTRPTYTCSYPAGTIGEQAVDIHGLLQNQLGGYDPVLQRAAGQLGLHHREPRPTSPHDAAART